MHAVPSGQVLLAEAPEDEVAEYVSAPLATFTPHTIVDAAALRRRLGEVRRVGYAWAVDEYSDGLSSVAAAIRDGQGRAIGALHVYGPTYRFPGERDPHRMGRLVVEAATRIRVE
jgi:DNA-binding IclR family transcriptional regulator